MGSDLESSLRKRAKEILNGIGVYEDKVPNFEELRKKIIENLRENYSNEVLRHFLDPRNMNQFSDPDGYAKVTGSCGDTMEIFLKVEDSKILRASFETDGCIASIASGDMATDLAEGKRLFKAQEIGQEDILDYLGGLPEDQTHCALLASDTLKEAIKACSGDD